VKGSAAAAAAAVAAAAAQAAGAAAGAREKMSPAQVRVKVAKEKAGIWACPVCTFESKATARTCAMCGLATK